MNTYLSISMQENIERKFLIYIPHNLDQAFLNVRLDPYSVKQKYVAVIIPTLNNNPLEKAPHHPHFLDMNLTMSLAPGGSSYPGIHNQMKIMLWNCRGENGLKFCCNLHFLLDWNNPSILCLTKTKMEYHTPFQESFNFTDFIQVAAQGYSGGMVLLWRAHDLTVNPITVTDISGTPRICPDSSIGDMRLSFLIARIQGKASWSSQFFGVLFFTFILSNSYPNSIVFLDICMYPTRVRDSVLPSLGDCSDYHMSACITFKFINNNKIPTNPVKFH
nr:uncharacterized protein LOC117279329 [Nicotiana tomentosiformis]